MLRVHSPAAQDVLLTNDGSRQESDRLIRVVAVREERLDHIVGERQPHDRVGGRPVCKQINKYIKED